MGMLQRMLKLIPKKATREERLFYTELAKTADTSSTDSSDTANSDVYKAVSKLGLPIDSNGSISVQFPQTPSGFTASPAFTNVILEWAAPTYSGHLYAEIFRADTDDLATAEANGVWLRSYASIINDAVDAGTTHYYWIRFVNAVSENGAWNSPNGTVATTSVPVEQMLTELAGRITETELATSLATPIAKIDGIDANVATLNGTVFDLQLTSDAYAQEIGDVRFIAENNSSDLVESVLNLSDAYSVEAQARRESLAETQRYLNAIITVDPNTGQITLDALDAYKSEFNTSISNINQQLDAINGKFTVKVWQSDIDAMGNQTLAAVNDEILARSGVCSISNHTDAATCIVNGGTWALSSLAEEKKTLLAYSDQGEVNSKAYADTVTTVVADGLAAEVLRTDGLATQFGSAESNIATLQTAVTSIEGENYTLQINNATSRLTTVESDVTGLQSDIATVQSSVYTRSETDQTIAGVVDFIGAGDVESSNQEALLAESLIQNALSISNEKDERRGSNATIIHNAETSKTQDEAIAKTVELLQANLDDSNAVILNEQVVRAAADTALSSQITTVQASLGDDIATVQTQATATASDVDGLLVNYGVKLDVNGYVTGFAQNNNGSTGSFYIRADEFAIIDPASTVDQASMTAQEIADSIPFSVVGGKTYIKNAYIKDLTAANLAADSVTADQINVADLSAVSADIGTVKVYNANISGAIQSDDYIQGQAGWQINKTGFCEFSDGYFRGTIDGSVIRGSTIIFTDQVRATQAGEPYYVFGSSKSNSGATTINIGYAGGPDWAYSALSPAFGYYAYNALPSGLDYPDHFYGSSVSIDIALDAANYNDYYNFGLKIDLFDSSGTFIANIFNYLAGRTDYWTVTQNGITATREYQSGNITASGSFTFTYSGHNYNKLKIRHAVYNIWAYGGDMTASTTSG